MMWCYWYATGNVVQW